MMHTREDRYHSLTIGMHWLTALLLVAVYALIEFKDFFPKGSSGRESMQNWHQMVGLAVFCLVFVRLALRGLFRAPAITPPPTVWQHRIARAMHLALYAFLIILPLLGWLTVSAKGDPVSFFGFEWPALVAPDKALGKSLKEIHETIGTIGYWLIGLHAAAALYHHYLVRDNTLARMWPRLGVRRR
jgi:cytochrome b561